MRVLAVTTFLSFSLPIFAAPVRDAEASLQDISFASALHRRDAIPVILIEPLKARGRINTSTGRGERSIIVEKGPIEARDKINACTGHLKREDEDRPVEVRAKIRCGGWSKREPESEAEVKAMADRDHIVPYPSEPIAVPVGGLIERARGSRSGGEESAADPRKFKSAGGSQRVAEPIKRAMGFPAGGSNTDSKPISNEGLAKRGHIVSWPRTPDAEASNNVVERGKGEPWILKRDAEPVDDLVERDPGLVRHPGDSPKRGLTPGRGGSYRREADSIELKSSTSHRREAETMERSMKNPGGDSHINPSSIKLGIPGGRRREAEPARSGSGGVPRDAAAQPRRFDVGKGHDRRDAIPGIVRPGGGTRPRDVILRGIRGNGADPRGVRLGNGSNP